MAREHAVNSIRDFDLRISDFGGGAEPVTDLPKNCRLEYRNFRVNFVFN